MTERLYLYDTTLRDGQQTQGVQFSTADQVSELSGRGVGIQSLRSGFLYLPCGIFLNYRLICFGVSGRDHEEATEHSQC